MNILPLVSIITVNFNGKRFLESCFDSLYGLNYPQERIEIIMVDNSSSDGSVEFMENNYSKVHVTLNKENNYCHANNLGIREAKGEYVALINNDTKADKNWLIELVKVMDSDKKIGAVTGKVLFIEDSKIQSTGHKPYPDFYWGDRGFQEEDKGQYDNIEEIPSICGCSVLYRRECLKDVGLLDEDFIMYMEDVDMSVRCTKKNWKLVYVPKSVIYHKYLGTGNKELQDFYVERNRLLFIAKHYPKELRDVLWGRGYFVGKNEERLYKIINVVFLKLIHCHGEAVFKEATRSVLGNLKEIHNFDLKEELQQQSERLKTEIQGLKANFEIKEAERARVKGELESVYNSTGFRYLLRPLWTVFWHIKNFFKFFNKNTNYYYSFTNKRTKQQNIEKTSILISDTAPLYPPLWGGPIRIWNLFGKLPQNFEVTYVNPDFRLNGKYSENLINNNFRELTVPITKLYFPFRWLEVKVIKNLSCELFSYLFMWFDLGFKRILRNLEADILISSHPWSFLCFKKKRKSQVMIYDAHNCEYRLMKMVMKKHWYRGIVSFLVKIIERQACEKSDIVFACSGSDALAFQRLYKVPRDKIHVVTNGTNLKPCIREEEKLKLKDELSVNKAVVFVGSYFNPNIEAAKFIAGHLAKELPDVTFFIAGSVKSAFQDNNLLGNIRMFGRVNDAELERIMYASDIAINPMISGSGINIKVLDYFSYGLPVITTVVGARGIGGINNEHLIICDLKNFSENVKGLLNDRALREKLNLNSRKLIEEKFIWSSLSNKIAEILRERVKSGTGICNNSKS